MMIIALSHWADEAPLSFGQVARELGSQVTQKLKIQTFSCYNFLLFVPCTSFPLHPQSSQSYRLIKSRCQEAKMSRCHWYMNMLTLQIRSSQDVKLPTNLVPDKRSTRRNMPGLFIHHITQCCHYCCCPSCSCSCCSCCCSLYLFMLLLFVLTF